MNKYYKLEKIVLEKEIPERVLKYSQYAEHQREQRPSGASVHSEENIKPNERIPSIWRYILDIYMHPTLCGYDENIDEYPKFYEIFRFEQEGEDLIKNSIKISNHIAYICKYPKLSVSINSNINRSYCKYSSIFNMTRSFSTTVDDYACIFVKHQPRFYDDYHDFNNVTRYITSLLVHTRMNDHIQRLFQYRMSNNPHSLYYLAAKKIIDNLIDSDDIDSDIAMITRKLPSKYCEFIKRQTYLNIYIIETSKTHKHLLNRLAANSELEIVSAFLKDLEEGLRVDWSVELTDSYK